MTSGSTTIINSKNFVRKQLSIHCIAWILQLDRLGSIVPLSSAGPGVPVYLSNLNDEDAERVEWIGAAVWWPGRTAYNSRLLYNATRIDSSLLMTVVYINPRILFAFLYTATHWLVDCESWLTIIPSSVYEH